MKTLPETCHGKSIPWPFKPGVAAIRRNGGEIYVSCPICGERLRWIEQDGQSVRVPLGSIEP